MVRAMVSVNHKHDDGGRGSEHVSDEDNSNIDFIKRFYAYLTIQCASD